MTFYKFYFDENGLVCEQLSNGKITTNYDCFALEQLKGLFKRKYYVVAYNNDKMTYTNGSERIVISDFSKIIKMISEETFDSMLDSTTRCLMAAYNTIRERQMVEAQAKEDIKNKTLIKFTAFMATTATVLVTATLSKEFRQYKEYEEYKSNTFNIEQDYTPTPIVDNNVVFAPALIDVPEDYAMDESLEYDIDNAEVKGYMYSDENMHEGMFNPADPIGADEIIYVEGRQTGICACYTNYTDFYNAWGSSSRQRTVADEWDEKGRTSDRGIATIDGRYLVAMTGIFGSAGDDVDIVLEDGTLIPCKLADIKGSGDATSSPYGHMLLLGNGEYGVDVVEWEIVGTKESVDLTSWAGKAVKYVMTHDSEKVKTLK